MSPLSNRLLAYCFVFFPRFFFPLVPLLFQPQKFRILWTKRVGHFYPGGSGIAKELAKSKPELFKELKEGLGGGWARGLGLGVKEAGGKGLQGSMGQLGRPSDDEGSCHRVLGEAGCLSGFRVREELDKTGGFSAPSSSCFYAEDDEATSLAAHEFGVCIYAPFCVGLRSRRFLHIARPCSVVGYLW